MEGTLDGLLKERAELMVRVDALDAEIRSAKEQRWQELLRELAALGPGEERPARRGSRPQVGPSVERGKPCGVCGFSTTPRMTSDATADCQRQ